MSDSNSMPPKTPEMSAVIFGYVNVQLALFVAIIYGMKNVEPWPYGVSRCDIAYFLFIAGFLSTTWVILINYAEARAESLARKSIIGAPRTWVGRVLFLPAISFGAYIVVTHGVTDYCEMFF